MQKGGNMGEINFDKMGIYDLRNYARSIGVLSPTKLKRQELIASINAIVEGIETPEKRKDGRGRPPKHKVDDIYMLDMFVPKNLFAKDNSLLFKPYENGNVYFSNGASVLAQSDNTQATDIAFDGYFVKKTDNYGLILKNGYQTDYFKENVIILKEEMESLCLRDGDFVEGVCKYIKDKNLMLAKEVLKINDISAECAKTRVLYEQIKADYPTKIIDISINNRFVDAKVINKVCPICFGSRAVINSQNSNDFVEFCSSLVTSVEQNGIITYLVSVDDCIEDIVEIQSCCENLNVIKHSSTVSREQFFEKLDINLKNACRRLENGENVAVVIYNAENLIENIKNYAMLKYKYEQDKALIFANDKLKDIFGLARASQNGSLTIVAFNLKNEEVLSVANCKINILAKSYAETDIFVDIKNSETKNAKKIFEPEYFEKLTSLKANFDETKIEKQLEVLFK